MIALALLVRDYGLTVRQLEEEVRKINKPKKERAERITPPSYVDYYREMEVKMQSHLGRRVEISDKGRKKSITLYYEDNEDLDDIITTLCGENFLRDF